MARKSRKQNNKADAPNLESSLIQTAAYVRLSFEDRKQKGSSIENQQHIIANYIEEHPEFELYDTYIDSGVSGTTFERPSFQRMLRDAEIGVISCIILKDLSRLGRSAIDTGYYVEKLFPKLGVRIISITDNYDSTIDAESITVPLINLVNEVYAIDISRKTRAQKRQAMKDGVYVGGRPPYGYKWSPDDRYKLIIDTSAAEIVRQIFTWAADNISIYEITRRLNISNTPSPETYLSETSVSGKTSPATSGLWRHGTIKNILKNEIYLGNLIQGKTKMINFVRQSAPADEWVSCVEAHEAIVSSELFEAAQILKDGSNKTIGSSSRTQYSANIFKGKIRCAHCGGYLERKKSHDKYIFNCVANRLVPDFCVGNRIAESDVGLAVLEQLLLHKERIKSGIKIPSIESNIISELRFAEMELSHTQDVARSLYENLVNHVLSKSEYLELKSGYKGKVDTLKQRIDELRQELNDDKREKAALRESLRILNDLAEAKELTKGHVESFVERIEVFRDGRVFVGVKKL